MSNLYTLINVLNKEEARTLKLLLKRTNNNEQRKDIMLFDLVRKGIADVDEKRVLKKLDYKSKNAFYRLKNRLIGDINKSLLQLYYNHSDFNFVINHITLAKLFIDKGNYTIALSYLKKAERKASEKEQFDLLELIYTELIKLSQETLAFNPLAYISKRKENRDKLRELSEVDDVLAALSYQIKTTQNFSNPNKELSDIIQKIINDFSITPTLKQSSRLRIKIYQTISRYLLQQHNYKALEDYLIKTYNEFKEQNLFNKSNHEIKLQMLTYLINSLFKNDKIEMSLKYTDELLKSMKEHNNLLYDKYLFYYYNSQVINYQVTDKLKAIEVLLEAKDKKTIQKLPIYTVFIYLNLAVLFFDIKEFKKSKRNIARLMLQDSYKELDKAFKLKICIVTLLLAYELNDVDYFDYQFKLIQKDFKDFLIDKNYKREYLVMNLLLEQFNGNPGQVKILKEKYLDEDKRYNNKDADVINYTAWINSKKF